MQTNNKKSFSLSWLVTIMLAVVLFAACNSGEAKKEETTTEPAAVEKAPEQPAVTTDTLPKVDTSASSRPDPKKTK